MKKLLLLCLVASCGGAQYTPTIEACAELLVGVDGLAGVSISESRCCVLTLTSFECAEVPDGS